MQLMAAHKAVISTTNSIVSGNRCAKNLVSAVICYKKGANSVLFTGATVPLAWRQLNVLAALVREFALPWRLRGVFLLLQWAWFCAPVPNYSVANEAWAYDRAVFIGQTLDVKVNVQWEASDVVDVAASQPKCCTPIPAGSFQDYLAARTRRCRYPPGCCASARKTW